MIDLGRAQDDATVLLSAIYNAPTPHVQREITERLRPRDEDYAAVFVASAVPDARLAYQALWAQSPALRTGPEKKQLLVHAVLSQDFGSPGSGRMTWFPGGYQKIAALLVPDVPWLCWKIADESGRGPGTLYDGLVSLGDRFAWFPKPWRAIARRASVSGQHWAE